MRKANKPCGFQIRQNFDDFIISAAYEYIYANYVSYYVNPAKVTILSGVMSGMTNEVNGEMYCAGIT